MSAQALELVAIDDADEDGGTLYVLYDGRVPVKAASWPMPLEAWARENGRAVRRRRRDTEDMLP